MLRLKRKKQFEPKINPAVIKTAFLRIAVVLLITGLKWIGLSTVLDTYAYFSDRETAAENILSVGTLDFGLQSKKRLNLEPGDKVNRTIQVRNEGTLSFQYTAWTEKISGDDGFCNTLWLEAKLKGEEKYQGRLIDFSFPPREIDTPPGIDTWQFKVSLPEDSNFQNRVCQFKFIFEAWQTDLPNSSDGFFDREEISIQFISSGLRINEDRIETIIFTDRVEVADSNPVPNDEEFFSDEFVEEKQPVIAQATSTEEATATKEITENIDSAPQSAEESLFNLLANDSGNRPDVSEESVGSSGDGGGSGNGLTRSDGESRDRGTSTGDISQSSE